VDNIEQVRIEPIAPENTLPTGEWKIRISGNIVNSVPLQYLQRYSLITQYFPDEEGGIRIVSDIFEEDINKLSFKDGVNNDVAWIGEKGNFALKGRIRRYLNNIQEESLKREFIIKNSTGQIVALLDLETGDLKIKGELYEHTIPTVDVELNHFIVKNATNEIVCLIDENGNLQLTGGLFEHYSP